MTAILMDGKKIAQEIMDEIKDDITHMWEPPLLDVILVGDNEASACYVRKKQEACKSVGMRSRMHHFDKTTPTYKVFVEIDKLNQDKESTGILLQLPLPPHMTPNLLLDKIDPNKDVDGFSYRNVGALHQQAKSEMLKPCTPLGIMELLRRYEIATKGANVVIVNRSTVVGQPLACMLSQQGDATVTMCHEHTKDVGFHTRNADIVVTAVGKRDVYSLKKDMIKPGAVVIDVGITRHEGKLTGDCEDDVQEVAGWLTPVPGGVGPLTVSMLLRNTMLAHDFQNGEKF